MRREWALTTVAASVAPPVVRPSYSSSTWPSLVTIMRKAPLASGAAGRISTSVPAPSGLPVTVSNPNDSGVGGVGLRDADCRNQIDIRRQIHPHLQALAKATIETAHLAVLEGLRIIYVDKVDGEQAVTMKSRVGDRGTCHSTSLGKVLLAHRPESEWRRYVREFGLTKRTANTITDAAAFYAALEAVRRHGHAIDDVENEDGIRCVAAPVRDHTGAVIAAMSISGWTLSMTPERVIDCVPVVVTHAHKASLDLGYNVAGR